tara:strand:+ start:49 stop:315 length:267 start_codon:yes stop_codon:yes gene_type:complete
MTELKEQIKRKGWFGWFGWFEMNKLQGWIWLSSLAIGYLTIMTSLEPTLGWGFIFLNVGFMTVIVLLDRIHNLELKISQQDTVDSESF